MKAIERIFQYIDNKKLNKSEFERKSGMSNGYLAKQFSRKADIGESMLNRILENCPDINPLWLLTGHGSMLKSDTYNYSVSSASVPPPVESGTPLERAYRELLEKEKAEVKELNREIGNLQAQLEASRKEVVSLELVNSTLREELELAKKNA